MQKINKIKRRYINQQQSSSIYRTNIERNNILAQLALALEDTLKEKSLSKSYNLNDHDHTYINILFIKSTSLHEYITIERKLLNKEIVGTKIF